VSKELYYKITWKIKNCDLDEAFMHTKYDKEQAHKYKDELKKNPKVYDIKIYEVVSEKRIIWR